MFGVVVGIPAFIIVFLAVNHYLTEWQLVGDRFAISALGACLGLCAYYSAKGIDIWLNEKKDNPEPFEASKPVPEAFGLIRQVFAETTFGPWSWNIKTVDTEETRILAVLHFKEIFGSGAVIPPTQAERIIMVQILVDPIPEAEQKPVPEGLPEDFKKITRIQINWKVDSPLGRFTVNRIIDDYTQAIKEALGLALAKKKEPKSPFEPPEWVIVLTVIAVMFAIFRGEQYEDYKKQVKEEARQREEQRQQAEADRQRQIAADKARREAEQREMEDKIRKYKEDQERKLREWQNQQSSPYTPPYTPYTPYTPPSTNPLNPSLDSPFRPRPNPFASPLIPQQTDQGSQSGPSWRGRYGGNN